MSKLSSLDQTDLQILEMMSQDAKIPYAEMGQKLFVSSGTIHVRIKKLTELGVITGSRINIDYTKLKFDVVAFVGIFLEKSQLYSEVSSALKNIREIISAHYTTGGYSIFTQIICRDTAHLQEILSTKIQKIDGIARTETFISLEQIIERPPSVIHMQKTT